MLTLPVTLDFTPPTLEVLGSTRYLAQGGGGLVALRARGASRMGVNAGGVFFPAVPAGAEGSGVMVAMLALPWDLAARASVSVLAQDEAGNTVTRGVPSEIKSKRFPTDTIELKEEFLKQKVAELLPERERGPLRRCARLSPDNATSARAAEQTKASAARSSPVQWEGPSCSRAIPKCSRTSRRRARTYQGRKGRPGARCFDLASAATGRSPANSAWSSSRRAEIYGTTVVLDHGRGLQTLRPTSPLSS